MTSIQTLSANTPSVAGARNIAGTTSSPFARRPAEDPAPDQHGRGPDTVELSDRARELARPATDSADAPREDLIRRVRAEIESGQYETADKLDVAAERLLKDLFA